MNNNIYLLLGSNLGDRMLILKSAISKIEDQIGNIQIQSKIYETAPWGNLDQPSFLNQVLRISTKYNAHKLLELCQSIEKVLGRVRHEKWGERLIDIDILYFDNQIIIEEELTIPHPHLQDRNFVLEPLNEIAAHFCHPVLNKTNQKLLIECGDTSEVKPIN